LVAALLHDAIEDAGVTGEELEQRFGRRVRDLVEEVSDDKCLPNEERKRLQIEHAPSTSSDGRLIKLADKVANLTDLLNSPPIDWPLERRWNYFTWAKAVVDGLRGGGTYSHERLEALFDETFLEGHRASEQIAGSGSVTWSRRLNARW
jgi:GTP diphosphokinase / guanosine-3',5'-bis(diphosphate) 3'-diphosphatase